MEYERYLRQHYGSRTPPIYRLTKHPPMPKPFYVAGNCIHVVLHRKGIVSLELYLIVEHVERVAGDVWYHCKEGKFSQEWLVIYARHELYIPQLFNGYDSLQNT